MTESQLTFSDITETSESSIYYSIVTEFISIITATSRERAGDNCSVVTRVDSNIDVPEFAAQIPPKTDVLELDIDTDISEYNYSYSVESISRREIETETVFVVTLSIHPTGFSGNIRVHAVLPSSDSYSTESETELVRDYYQSFDFKEFVSNEFSTEQTD